MDIAQAEEIRMKWGVHLEHLAPKLIQMFRAKIPESLLPNTKDEIAEAIEVYADALADEGQDEAADQLRSSLSFLLMYSDDKESLESAMVNFNNKEFIEVFYKNR